MFNNDLAMKILFVQKRYHSNQHCAVKSLINNGHHVCYYVQLKGPSENYELLVPELIPHSMVFSFIWKFVLKIFKYRINRAEYGFPSIFGLYQKIKKCDPDVVIIKKYRMFSKATALICKILNKPVVLYTQGRVVNAKNSHVLKRSSLKKRFSLKPTVRFSPASGILSGNKPLKINNTYYIPLVIESSNTERRRKYREDGCVRILSIGKYKNLSKKRQDLLITAFQS